MTRCGVLGTGAVGRGMVESLVRAGFPVSAFDLDGRGAHGGGRARCRRGRVAR